MKLNFLRLNTWIKPSLISESVVEIRTNIHLAREKPDNTTYAWSRGPYVWQQFVMIIKVLGWVLPHPSACLPHDTSTGIRGWPTHYYNVYPLSNVGYRPTWRPYKLLSLWDPIILYASVHNQSCSLGPDDQSSIETAGGYHLQSFEYENIPLSLFPFGILHFSLVAPPGLT
jgi:hypothetical protein